LNIRLKEKRYIVSSLFADIIVMVAASYLSFFLGGCTWKADISRKISGKVPVVFIYTGKAETVCISGDFNNWSSNTDCFKRNGNTWSISISLLPGRYRYTFFVDEIRWIPDPNAFLQEDDGFGMKNSVLIVE
jgi:hypothetical protein